MSTKKNKSHLTLHYRIKIQAGIERGSTAKAIAYLCRTNISTIYREIKRNLTIRKNNTYKNICANRHNCVIFKNSHGSKCNPDCHKFIRYICPEKTKFPFVCNNCPKKNNCNHDKQFYYADKADELSTKRLIETRLGIRINEEEFNVIDNIVSPLILKKQSLNHILTTHTEIDVSERTLRNWINKGYMKARNVDLPRKVAFKVDRNYVSRISKPASILEGRMYKDYKLFVKKHPEKLVSQFDTVHGLISDNKTVLTIHFPSISFQFGILLSSCETNEVNAKLFELRKKIGLDEWKRIFPIMLTDNGIEFNRIHELEVDEETGEIISNVFFCDPYKSSQKGSCERNHELFRYIQPKKHSIEYLTQDILNDYFSNINCLYRKGLNGVRPYDLAKLVLGEHFLSIIGIFEVKPDDVTFKKKELLKK